MKYEFKKVQAGGISLAYVEQGHGIPIVFVHGSGPTDLCTWGQQIEPFARHFRVIAYSQRYHYPNSWIGDGSDINSTTVHAQDLASLVVALRLGQVHLVGVSYGADIALRLAVEYPELIRTLVVIEPALFSWLVTLPGGSTLFSGYATKMIPAKEAVLKGDLEQGLRLFIESFMGSGVYDQLPTSLHDRMMDNLRLLGAEPTMVSEIGPDITRDEAATIQAPTLLLTGDESPEMFLLVGQELARHVPNLEQRQIGEASHLLHVMNPQAFNMTVLTFLGKYAGDHSYA